MKAFQASAKGAHVTAATPRAAAQKFFACFPRKRKCSVIEGETDGMFFTIRYGRASLGEWPQSWSNVTPQAVDTLPDVAEVAA